MKLLIHRMVGCSKLLRMMNVDKLNAVIQVTHLYSKTNLIVGTVQE